MGRTKLATSPQISVRTTSFGLVLPHRLRDTNWIIRQQLFLPGERMKISWEAPAVQTSATDWVGLYKVGDLDTAAPQWRHNTGGGDMGSATVVMPRAVGDYEFRYFSGVGSVKKATSSPIRVIDASKYQLTPSATTVAAGGMMDISLQSPGRTRMIEGQNTYDWIGLYKVGDSDAAPQWRAHTGGYAGRKTVQLPSTAGDYEFRYFFSHQPTGETKRVKAANDDGYEDIYFFHDKFTGEYRKVETSVVVKVEAAKFEVMMAETLALPGERIEIAWQTAAGQASTTDWVGLYKAGDSDAVAPQWRHDNTVGADVGSTTVVMPSVSGDYELRYFSSNAKKATSRKVKVVDASGYQVEVSATTVEAGGRIGMLWQVPAGQTHAWDWVGLYQVGDSDTAYQWKQRTNGVRTGSVSVKMPSVAGDYEFRYFFNKVPRGEYKQVETSFGNYHEPDYEPVYYFSEPSTEEYRKAATSAKVMVRASSSGAGSGGSGSAGGTSQPSRRQRTEVIRYTYDGWDVIREAHSVKGITTYQNGLGIDDKLRSKKDNVVRYFLTDHLGSTEALAGSSGRNSLINDL